MHVEQIDMSFAYPVHDHVWQHTQLPHIQPQWSCWPAPAYANLHCCTQKLCVASEKLATCRLAQNRLAKIFMSTHIFVSNHHHTTIFHLTCIHPALPSVAPLCRTTTHTALNSTVCVCSWWLLIADAEIVLQARLNKGCNSSARVWDELGQM